MLNKIQEKIKNKLDEIKYVSSTHVAASMCNSETFKPILDCNIGREVVLCGAGPTLKQYKPINGALHVAPDSILCRLKRQSTTGYYHFRYDLQLLLLHDLVDPFSYRSGFILKYIIHRRKIL